MDEDKLDFKNREVRRKEIVYRIVNAEGKPVSLAAMHIDDHDMMWIEKILEKYPHIRSMNLSANRITNIGAKQLAQNKTLKELDISFNTIDDSGMKHFRKNHTILNLVYAAHDVGYVARCEIISMLERNNQLASKETSQNTTEQNSGFMKWLMERFRPTAKKETVVNEMPKTTPPQTPESPKII